MRALVIILAVVAILSGCKKDHRNTSTNDFEIICLDGTQYWIRGSWSGNIGYGYMAPRQKPDGTGYACGYQQQPTDVIYPQ